MALTKEQQDTVLASLREGNSPEQAARSVGTSRRTLLRLRQSDEAFALAYDDAWESGLDMVEQQLFDMALGRTKASTAQFQSAIAIMNGRRASVYKRFKPDEQPRAPKKRDLSELSEEELRDLERLLSKIEQPG